MQLCYCSADMAWTLQEMRGYFLACIYGAFLLHAGSRCPCSHVHARIGTTMPSINRGMVAVMMKTTITVTNLMVQKMKGRNHVTNNPARYLNQISFHVTALLSRNPVTKVLHMGKVKTTAQQAMSQVQRVSGGHQKGSYRGRLCSCAAITRPYCILNAGFVTTIRRTIFFVHGVRA